MKKQEFIEKYGLEEYKRYLEQQKERNHKYRENNPEYFRKRYKEKSEYFSRYREEHAEERKEYNRKHYKKHAEELKEYFKEYQSNTKQGRANALLQAYKHSDRKQNRGECTLTPSWIVDKIFSSSCVYCGETDWHKLGCDRINNNLPHTEDNVVCACGKCNVERNIKDFNVFCKKKKG